jgi:succinate dehydrogenase/fumarate reductase cytochrome b subunit
MSIFAPVYDFLHSKAGLALFLTLLLIGLWNMFRAPAGNTSQKLMRWRVGLQFGAICLILLFLLLKR